MNPTEPITSIKDPRVVLARELSTAAGRARAGRSFCDGFSESEIAQLTTYLRRIQANCVGLGAPSGPA